MDIVVGMPRKPEAVAYHVFVGGNYSPNLHKSSVVPIDELPMTLFDATVSHAWYLLDVRSVRLVNIGLDRPIVGSLIDKLRENGVRVRDIRSYLDLADYIVNNAVPKNDQEILAFSERMAAKGPREVPLGKFSGDTFGRQWRV